MNTETRIGGSSEFVVLVPLANPESESHLISLGAAIATQRNGRVVAVNLVDVPDQTSLEAAREQFDYEASKEILRDAERSAAEGDVPISTHVVFTHDVFRGIFDAARRHDADVCLMGWGPGSPGIGGRAESLSEEVAGSLPCDVLVFRDRGFDPSRVLLPTTGGPHTDLAALVASILQEEYGSTVTLLHVADDVEEGEAFLTEWAADHYLSDATVRVESGDVESAIGAAAADHTMILIGATESGVLARLVHGSLTLSVLHDVDCSVLITEKQTTRGLLDRLFRR